MDLFLNYLFKQKMSFSRKVLTDNSRDKTSYLGIAVNVINTSGDPKNRGPRKNKPYFFLPQQGENRIMHCKIYGDGFLDYTIQGTRFFETLEEWVVYYGFGISDIQFGFESTDVRFKSVMLKAYLKEQTEAYFRGDNDFLLLEQRLAETNLGFDNLAVVHDNKVTMATDFMK